MKCPRAFAWQWELGHTPQFAYGACLKEECAWWLEDIKMCSIRDLALELRYTQLRLQDIVGKPGHTHDSG